MTDATLSHPVLAWVLLVGSLGMCLGAGVLFGRGVFAPFIPPISETVGWLLVGVFGVAACAAQALYRLGGDSGE